MGETTDLLRIVARRENLAILSALAAGPEYPRRLAARLHRQETHVAQRLRLLERAGFIQSNRVREDGKNVRLYHLKTRAFNVTIDEHGIRLHTRTTETDHGSSDLERVPTRGSIFGRQQELAKLSDPGTRFSMVVGLPGMGKTSLATELAHRHGIDRVVWHTFTPFDSASRLLALARRWLAVLNPSRRKDYEKATWEIPELLDRVTDGLSRQRILVVLDDYQNVRDDAIHEIVRRWQRTLVHARVAVLSRDRPPLDMDGTTQLITLSGLRPAAAVGLLRENGMKASPAEMHRLERAFGGHPLSLLLYARKAGGTPGTAFSIGEDIAREAFQSLDVNSQQVLLTLAAVRRPLGLEGIRFLTGLKDPGLPLAVLQRRAMIQSDSRSYKIHDFLRESLDSIMASRPEIHRRATALFLSSEHGDDIVEGLYHATKARDWAVAGNLLERYASGEREMPSTSVSALVFLEILDEIPVDKLEARHQAIFHRSHALALLGGVKITVVIRELETARRIAERLGDSRILSWVLSPLGYYLGHTGRMAEAERTLVRNLRLVESEGNLADQADALFMLALLYDRQGRHERAKEHWRRALRVAREMGNKRVVLEFLTWPVAFPSNWRQMLPRLRRWRADFRQWGMPRQVEAVDIQAGEILCRAERYRTVPRRSDLRKAIELLERAITGCEAIGNRYEALYARSWLSLAFFLAEEYERAEVMANETLRSDRRIGPTHCAILGQQVLSRVSLWRGDMKAARKESDQAVRVARRMHCGCLGISLLERAILGDGSAEKVDSRGALDKAISETIRTGYPDEVRYARLVARQDRAVLDHESGEVASQHDSVTANQTSDGPERLSPREITSKRKASLQHESK